MRTKKSYLRFVVWAAATLMSFILVAPVQAACDAVARADAQATERLLQQAKSQESPHYEEMLAMFRRARTSCLDLRPVRAIVEANIKAPARSQGLRLTKYGVDLRSVSVSEQVTWRLDLIRSAQRVSALADSPAKARVLATLDAASWGTSAKSFSDDPTRLAWNPSLQSSIALVLSRSSSVQDRVLAQQTLRAFSVGARKMALMKVGLITHLRIVNRVNLASNRVGVNNAIKFARTLTFYAFARVRMSSVQGWSKVDGAWATNAQHRALVDLAGSLLRQVKHEPTKHSFEQLKSALVTPAAVNFVQLPSKPFFPWPRDGAFDSQKVAIKINKPAVVYLVVFAADGSVVSTKSLSALPGIVTLSWDGTNKDGNTLEEGSYRYNITTRDRAGNGARVAGLNAFVIERDRKSPTIESVALRIIGKADSQRAIVSWAVNEEHSPKVRTWLVLRMGDETLSVKLHDQLQKATVRRNIKVAKGAWSATLIAIDGSANRAQYPIGRFQVS